MVSSDGRTAAPGLGDWFEPYELALGVGNHEDPVTEVRGADGGSGYAVPLRVIPARGQVSEYVAKSPLKETWDVLQQHPCGSYVANDVHERRPEVPLVLSAELATRKAEGLAGESSGDQVNSGSGSCGPPVRGCADVVMPRHLRPVLGQHAPAEFVFFDLAYAGHTRAVEAKI